MTRFQAPLERIDGALSLPQPQRGRVIAEIAADLDDIYGALRAEGLRSADAELRALELVLPDTAALRELEQLHQPLYRRLTSRLTQRTRLHVERASVVLLSLGVVGLTFAGLPLHQLLRDPSPFLLPVMLPGCAALLVALVCALRICVIGVASPADGARGLDLLVLLAAAGPFVATLALLTDFYLVAGSIQADPSQAATLLIRLLRTDGVLLVMALCLSLLASLSWLLLRSRLAVVRDAAAALRTAVNRPALMEDRSRLDVA